MCVEEAEEFIAKMNMVQNHDLMLNALRFFEETYFAVGGTKHSDNLARTGTRLK